MATLEREKRFRITGRDNNGDIHAFETDNRGRAKAKLQELQAARDLHDVNLETLPWV